MGSDFGILEARLYPMDISGVCLQTPFYSKVLTEKEGCCAPLTRLFFTTQVSPDLIPDFLARNVRDNWSCVRTYHRSSQLSFGAILNHCHIISSSTLSQDFILPFRIVRLRSRSSLDVLPRMLARYGEVASSPRDTITIGLVVGGKNLSAKDCI